MMQYQMYPSFNRDYSPSHSQPNSQGNSRNASPSTTPNADVMLIAQGERFPTSRDLLINASPVFARMLTAEENGEYRRRVHVNGINAQVLALMLKFLHNGTLNLCCADTALALLEPAQRYQLEPLSDFAEQFLLETVDVEHYCEMYAFACDRGLISLKQAFRDQIAEDLDEFSETAAFAKLEIGLVEELVQHAALMLTEEVDVEEEVDCEFELVDAIARWLRPEALGPEGFEPPHPEDHSWGRKCEQCLMNGNHQLKAGYLYRDVEPELNREHYEERLFRLVDLDLFENEELMELKHFAESHQFAFLTEAVFNEMEQREAEAGHFM